MTPIEDTMIHAAERFLAHHSTAAAVVLPLPDGKVVAVGTEAQLAKMIKGTINYAWKPNIMQLSNACCLYEEYGNAGRPEQGMAKALEYFADCAPSLPDTVQPAAPCAQENEFFLAVRNIPYDESKANEDWSDRSRAYMAGHADARRAASELVADFLSATAIGLQQKVIEWAKARQIIPNAKAATQLMKTGSELGELFDAEIKGDRPGIIDGIGDVLVTLIIYAELNGLTIDQCLAAAYEEIKDRTGTLLPSGVFVKD